MLSPLARQIAALGLALCAVALSLAYPLRNYLQQQVAERQAVAEQHQLEDEIADLTAQKDALSDPAYIKSEAKQRLQYVSPGDTVYVVKLPPAVKDAAAESDVAPPVGQQPPGTDNGSSTGTDNGSSSGTSDGSTAGTDNSAGHGSTDGTPANGADSGTDAQPWYSDLWDTVAGDDSATTTSER